MHGVGGLDHAQWRAFQNERRYAEATNFVDGDLIELFLDLKPEQQAEVAEVGQAGGAEVAEVGGAEVGQAGRLAGWLAAGWLAGCLGPLVGQGWGGPGDGPQLHTPSHTHVVTHTWSRMLTHAHTSSLMATHTSSLMATQTSSLMATQTSSLMATQTSSLMATHTSLMATHT